MMKNQIIYMVYWREAGNDVIFGRKFTQAELAKALLDDDFILMAVERDKSMFDKGDPGQQLTSTLIN